MAKSKKRYDDEYDDDYDDEPRRPVKKNKKSKRAVSLPPGTPTVYYHSKCDEETVMPDDVIATYLEDPWTYDETTQCAHCGKAVPLSKCYWVDNDERLLDYFEDLKAEDLLYGDRDPGPRDAMTYYTVIPGIGAVFGAIVGAVIGSEAGISMIGCGLVGLVVGAGAGLIHGHMTLQKDREGQEKYNKRIIKNYKRRHPEPE